MPLPEHVSQGFLERKKKTFFYVTTVHITHLKNRSYQIKQISCTVSVAQLVATRDNRGSNPGFPTPSHIMCVNLPQKNTPHQNKVFPLLIVIDR